MTSTHSGPWSAARYDLTAEIFEMITIGYKLSGNFCTHSSCFFAEMISSQTIQRRENNVKNSTELRRVYSENFH